ncbi:MAG: D-alanine--D-alanine ligase [Xanthomonadales bacterium]|nr:D-alanine--D-alanine ligase [Xanthomonadales bacterium]
MNHSGLHPEKYGCVALVVGGDSPERAVSLAGGKSVAAALARMNIDYVVFDGVRPLFEAIEKGTIERVFNLMHGTGGEDGRLTGALDLLKTPVTGSSVLGSALTMDKVRSKQIWKSAGIPTTDFILSTADRDDSDKIFKAFDLPLFVKPVDQGSSLGISKVTAKEQLPEAIALAASFSSMVIVEPGIAGREYFAGIIDSECLPLIAVEPDSEFYDYKAKYESNQTRYFCPCGLSAEIEKQLQQLAKRAFDELDASGWGRVDFILDESGKPWFLEVNTIPGMTDHSLIPQAAAQAGMDFDQLVLRILDTSFSGASL